jgi:hypothetical protein
MGKWDDEFTFSTYLEEDHQFRLYWNLLDDDVIEFGMEANSTGWIAIGLSENGGMKYSDIMLGWVSDEDGSVTLQDRYVEGTNSRPLVDEESNLVLIEGEQENGITRIRFQRTKSVDCGDTSGHDRAVAQGTSRVIYAYNHNDGDEDDADSIDYHGANQRGSQSVDLWYGQGTEVELEDDVAYFDVVMSNYSMPAVDTQYVCKLIKLPTFSETQHMVMFEPLIQKENEGSVHHIILYGCPKDWVSDTPDDSHVHICDDAATNMPSKDCRQSGIAPFGWAVGGGNQYLPKEAGIKVGGDVDFHYAWLELHYDNPELRSDIVDSSGVRIWHTPTLRTHDAGGVAVTAMITAQGGVSKMFLPPGIVTTVTAFVDSDCTTYADEGASVQAYASSLHSHKRGVSMKLRHIRDGVELEPLGYNEHYDFNFQQITMFPEEVTLLPGDQLVLECTYDTTDEDDVILFAESTWDEMCVGGIAVYPVPDFMGFHIVDFAQSAVDKWLDDAYDLGLWDVDLNGSTVQDLIDSPNSNISSPSDIHPNDWEEFGGFWNRNHQDAATFFDKFWDDSEYSARESICVTPNNFSFIETTFDDELGEFEEYCTDSCGCDIDGDRAVDDNGDEQAFATELVVVTAIGGTAVVAVAVLVVMLWLNHIKTAKSGNGRGSGAGPAVHVPDVTPSEVQVPTTGGAVVTV